MSTVFNALAVNDCGNYTVTLSGWTAVARGLPCLRDCSQKSGRGHYCLKMHEEHERGRDVLYYDLTPSYAKRGIYELVRTFTSDDRERSVEVEDYIDNRLESFGTEIIVGDARIEPGEGPFAFVLFDPKGGRRVRVDISGESENRVGIVAKVANGRILIDFAAAIERGSITVKYTLP